MDTNADVTTTPAIPLPRGDIRALADALTGRVVTPGDEAYADASRLYNAAVEHTPEAVAQVADTADVVTAVRFARERGIDLSVKGGAHGVVGYATAGRLVIDLGHAMNGVDVDPVRRIAKVGGGAVWGAVDAATQAHGLATPAGRVTHTGVAGLTLGGGQGWLSSKHGLTIDNLLEVELVTADGRVVTASETSEPELFWALRGGGGNFGVATSFTFGLHPLGPTILGGLLVWTPDKAPELIRFYDELLTTASEDFGGCLGFLSAPPEPFVPPEAVGQPIVVAILGWFGDPAEGEKALAPLRAFGPPMMDLVGPMPYTALQSIIDAANPFGLRNYWSAAYVNEITDAFIADTVDVCIDRPSPMSGVLLAPMGFPASRVPQESTAFGNREARYLYHPLGVWSDAADDETNIAWVRRATAAAAPHVAAGTYLNVDTAQTSRDRVRFAFGEDAYRRLVDVKRAWDPDNVFHHNANIDPANIDPANISPAG